MLCIKVLSGENIGSRLNLLVEPAPGSLSP